EASPSGSRRGHSVWSTRPSLAGGCRDLLTRGAHALDCFVQGEIASAIKYGAIEFSRVGALEGIPVNPPPEGLFIFPTSQHLVFVVNAFRRATHQHFHPRSENIETQEAWLVFDRSLALAEHLLEVFFSSLFYRNVVDRDKHLCTLRLSHARHAGRQGHDFIAWWHCEQRCAWSCGRELFEARCLLTLRTAGHRVNKIVNVCADPCLGRHTLRRCLPALTRMTIYDLVAQRFCVGALGRLLVGDRRVCAAGIERELHRHFLCFHQVPHHLVWIIED